MHSPHLRLTLLYATLLIGLVIFNALPCRVSSQVVSGFEVLKKEAESSLVVESPSSPPCYPTPSPIPPLSFLQASAFDKSPNVVASLSIAHLLVDRLQTFSV